MELIKKIKLGCYIYQQLPQVQSIPHIQNIQHVQVVRPIVQRQQHMPQPQTVERMMRAYPKVILVNRNHDADEVVRIVQQQNIRAHNNIGQPSYLLCLNMLYKLNFLGVAKFLSSRRLLVIPVNLLSNI